MSRPIDDTLVARNDAQFAVVRGIIGHRVYTVATLPNPSGVFAAGDVVYVSDGATPGLRVTDGVTWTVVGSGGGGGSATLKALYAAGTNVAASTLDLDSTRGPLTLSYPATGSIAQTALKLVNTTASTGIVTHQYAGAIEWAGTHWNGSASVPYGVALGSFGSGLGSTANSYFDFAARDTFGDLTDILYLGLVSSRTELQSATSGLDIIAADIKINASAKSYNFTSAGIALPDGTALTGVSGHGSFQFGPGLAGSDVDHNTLFRYQPTEVASDPFSFGFGAFDQPPAQARADQVMYWGWNLSNGGGRINQAARHGAMGWSLEQYFEGSNFQMEGHWLYVDPANTQHRPISMLANLDAPYDINFFIGGDPLQLRGSSVSNASAAQVTINATTVSLNSPSGGNRVIVDDSNLLLQDSTLAHPAQLYLSSASGGNKALVLITGDLVPTANYGFDVGGGSGQIFWRNFQGEALNLNSQSNVAGINATSGSSLLQSSGDWGAIRYNQITQHWESSENTSTYSQIPVVGRAQTWTAAQTFNIADAAGPYTHTLAIGPVADTTWLKISAGDPGRYTDFYGHFSSTANPTYRDDVWSFGFNVNAGGGPVIPGRGALSLAMESIFNGGHIQQEAHWKWLDVNALETRFISFEGHIDDNSTALYIASSVISLRSGHNSGDPESIGVNPTTTLINSPSGLRFMYFDDSGTNIVLGNGVLGDPSRSQAVFNSNGSVAFYTKQTAGASGIGRLYSSAASPNFEWDNSLTRMLSPNGLSNVLIADDSIILNINSTTAISVQPTQVVIQGGRLAMYSNIADANANSVDVGPVGNEFRTGRFATSVVTPLITNVAGSLNLDSFDGFNHHVVLDATGIDLKLDASGGGNITIYPSGGGSVQIDSDSEIDLGHNGTLIQLNGVGGSTTKVNGQFLRFFDGGAAAAQATGASITDFATLKTYLQSIGLIGA